MPACPVHHIVAIYDMRSGPPIQGSAPAGRGALARWVAGGLTRREIRREITDVYPETAIANRSAAGPVS
jgi:hypothetical protein